MNNKKQIFFAVMIVTIITITVVGSTYAYFLISKSGTNSVNASSLNVNGKITLDEEPDPRTTLIPVTQANAIASYNQSGSGAKAKCKGVSSNATNTTYDLCSTYKFTITNTATVAQTVKITFSKVTNTFGNLNYCLFTGTSSNVTGSCGAVPGSTAITLLNNVSISASGSVNYTIMLFVKETGSDQTSSDAGKSFTGRITVTTNTGSNIEGIISS